MDWTNLAQDLEKWWTFVNTVMNLWVLWNAGNFFLTSWGSVSFSRTLHGVGLTNHWSNSVQGLALLTGLLWFSSIPTRKYQRSIFKICHSHCHISPHIPTITTATQCTVTLQNNHLTHANVHLESLEIGRSRILYCAVIHRVPSM
jgi:hypothetical protein